MSHEDLNHALGLPSAPPVDLIDEYVRHLPAREKTIVTKYYGLGTDRMSLGQIAEQAVWEISPARIRQLHLSALRHLRKTLGPMMAKQHPSGLAIETWYWPVSQRLRNALSNNHLKSLDDVLRKPRNHFFKMKGFGKTIIKELETLLEKHGHKLKEVR